MINIDKTCGILKDWQVLRKFIIKVEVENTNRMNALVARYCGYDPTAEDAEKLWTRAGNIVKCVISGKSQADDDDQNIADRLQGELGAFKVGVGAYLIRRKEIEDAMMSAALTLPAASIIENTAGFNATGLAVIVGEAGNLSNYSSVRKLWRRLGLGMAQGHESKAYSTWRKEGGLSAEDWTIAGYSPTRLAQIYGVISVPLAMHKKKNKYGEIYDKRRAHTKVTHPEWYVDKKGKAKVNAKGEPSSAHAANDAIRIITKAFLFDLWKCWNQSMTNVKNTVSLAEDEQSKVKKGVASSQQVKSRAKLVPA